jgi:hypothetical protein
MNPSSLQQRIARLQATYAYELAEGFCKINAQGRLQHTTDEELGIAEDAAEGLQEVLVEINALLRSQHNNTP